MDSIKTASLLLEVYKQLIIKCWILQHAPWDREQPFWKCWDNYTNVVGKAFISNSDGIQIW